MSWIRIDDQISRHSKMVKAGSAACWVWVCGLAHCQSQLTDGYIDEALLPMVCADRNIRSLASKLVEVGLWEKCDHGYKVHDYLDFNASRAEVLARRAEDSARKHGQRLSRNPGGIRVESGRNPGGVQPSHPIPSHPAVVQNTTGARKTPKARADKPPDPQVKDFLVWFQEAYSHYRNDAKCLISWGKDGKHVKEMLAVVDYERLKILAKMMLRTEEDDFIINTGRDIGVLRAVFNRLNDYYSEKMAERQKNAGER